jgi:hypothetical protein
MIKPHPPSLQTSYSASVNSLGRPSHIPSSSSIAACHPHQAPTVSVVRGVSETMRCWRTLTSGFGRTRPQGRRVGLLRTAICSFSVRIIILLEQQTRTSAVTVGEGWRERSGGGFTLTKCALFASSHSTLVGKTTSKPSRAREKKRRIILLFFIPHLPPSSM